MATVKWCLGAVTIAFCCTAFGRDEEGRLDRILLPHEGRPAVAAPGEVLRITAREVGTASLETDGERFELTTVWRGIEGGLALGEARLPTTIPPGRYDMIWRNESVTDRNVASVRIVAESAARYTLRVVREPALHDPAAIDAVFAEIGDRVDGVLIWGGLAAEDEEIHLRLLKHLRAAEYDVFVMPEDTPLNRAIWGSAPARLPLGRDSVLVFSFAPRGGLSGSIAEERIYRLRRESVADRWTVGISKEPPGRDGIRNGLTSLADEPLAYLALPLPEAEPRTPRAFPAARIGSLMAPLEAGESVEWIFEASGVSTFTVPDAP